MFPGERRLEDAERRYAPYETAAAALRVLLDRAASAYEIRHVGRTYVARRIGGGPSAHFIWDADYQAWVSGVGLNALGKCDYRPYVEPISPAAHRQLRVGDIIKHISFPMIRTVESIDIANGRVVASTPFTTVGGESKESRFSEGSKWRDLWVFDDGTSIPDVRLNDAHTAIARPEVAAPPKSAWDRLLDDEE